MYCKHCGNQISDVAIMCPACGAPVKEKKTKPAWPIPIGIISMVMSLPLFFLAPLLGAANTILENKEITGTFTILIALMMLCAGIVVICVRSKPEKTAATALYAIATVLGVLAVFSGFSFVAPWVFASVAFFTVCAISTWRNREY